MVGLRERPPLEAAELLLLSGPEDPAALEHEIKPSDKNKSVC